MSKRPTNSEARKHTDKFDKFGKALHPASRNGPARAEYDTVFDNDYNFKAAHPRYPDYVYPDDTKADTRIQGLFKTGDFFGANHVINIKPQDIDYLQKKKEARELLDFKQFVEDSVPRGTPWAKKYFERFMPGWHDSKNQIIRNKLEFVKRLKNITMYGPKSQDDMMVLYLIYTGQVEIPETVDELIHGIDQTIPSNLFHSGKWNPKRFADRKVYVTRRNQEYMANFSIPGIDSKGIASLVGTNAIDPEVEKARSEHIITQWDDTPLTEARRNWERDTAAFVTRQQEIAAIQAANGQPGAVQRPVPQALNDPGEWNNALPQRRTVRQNRFRMMTVEGDVNDMFRINNLPALQRRDEATARAAGYLGGGEFDKHFRKIETTRDPPRYSSAAWNTRGTRGWSTDANMTAPGPYTGPGGLASWPIESVDPSRFDRTIGLRPETRIGTVGAGADRVRINTPQGQTLRDMIQGDVRRAGYTGHQANRF